MSLTVSTRCPGCEAGLELDPGINTAVCGSCGLSSRISAGGSYPPMHAPNRLDAAGAAGAAKEALGKAGSAYASVREATLFYIPFRFEYSVKLHWEVLDVVRAPDGSRKVAPRPLLGYGEDVLMGLLMGGGHDPAERKLELAQSIRTRMTPMLAPDGIELRASEPMAVSPLPDKTHGFLVAADPDITGGPPMDVPNMEATVSARTFTVYMPFWVVETSRADSGEVSLAVIDGTDGSVLDAEAPTALLDRLLRKPPATEHAGLFSPYACPECGGGLVGGAHDAVVFCPSCRMAHGPDGPLPYTVLKPAVKPGPDVVHLPVWAVDARLVSPDRVVDSRYELLRFAPGKGWPKEEDKGIPMRFFMPAFRMENLIAFTRASAGMTSSQPFVPDESAEKAVPARGCLFGPSDAMRLSTLMLYATVPKGNKVSASFALTADVEPLEPRLLLVPFAKSKFDYRDAVTGTSIPASAIGV